MNTPIPYSFMYIPLAPTCESFSLTDSSCMSNNLCSYVKILQGYLCKMNAKQKIVGFDLL